MIRPLLFDPSTVSPALCVLSNKGEISNVVDWRSLTEAAFRVNAMTVRIKELEEQQIPAMLRFMTAAQHKSAIAYVKWKKSPYY